MTVDTTTAPAPITPAPAPAPKPAPMRSGTKRNIRILILVMTAILMPVVMAIIYEQADPFNNPHVRPYLERDEWLRLFALSLYICGPSCIAFAFLPISKLGRLVTIVLLGFAFMFLIWNQMHNPN